MLIKKDKKTDIIKQQKEMIKRENHYNQEFFDKLSEKLEEIYPKGSKERSSALVFNAYANMIANEIIENRKQKIKKYIEATTTRGMVYDGIRSKEILKAIDEL